MNRLERKFSELERKGEKALTLFLTDGFPKLDSTVPLVWKLEEAGADVIELGMPFSDPLADGPVIQASSAAALKNGVTLEKILRDVKAIRTRSNIPIVLMGYVNPILNFGADKFFRAAAKADVDGMIFPELPFEEAGRFRPVLRHLGLSNILLVAPTSTPQRIAAIDRMSSGFLYCVSSTGVTGTHGQGGGGKYLRNVKRHVKKNPVLVGFGISEPDDAKRYARHADGVIVGSALIKKIAQGDSMSSIVHWVRLLKSAIISG